MSDSLPIPARSGLARAPLDPTDVVPGPQPIESAARDGHTVIVGEVLNKGRHRAFRPRRKVALSGAVLSAAGAFVTLALMMSHDSTSASASPRVTPSTPMPDLPDEPTASAAPTRSAAPAPTHTAVPHSRSAAAAPSAARTPEQERQSFGGAAQFRQEAVRSAEAWANAMRQAQSASARQQQASSSEYRAGAWQASGGAHGSHHAHGHGHGHHRGAGGR